MTPARPAVDERMEKRRRRATNAASDRRSDEGNSERPQRGRRIGLQRTLAGGVKAPTAAVGPMLKDHSLLPNDGG